MDCSELLFVVHNIRFIFISVSVFIMSSFEYLRLSAKERAYMSMCLFLTDHFETLILFYFFTSTDYRPSDNVAELGLVMYKYVGSNSATDHSCLSVWNGSCVILIFRSTLVYNRLKFWIRCKNASLYDWAARRNEMVKRQK